ncbi:unnamed protein product [Amoebophrya sp. A120]|nr:unnamed protein product [Amoebophrya sp. A120]|eukprot:GSA120T00003791001.1
MYSPEKDKLTGAAYDNLPGGFCPPKFETNGKNRFTNKTVIVTGGAGNFGKSCALRMASEGCNIALWDLVDASPVVEEIRRKYPEVNAKSYQLNVTEHEKVEEVAKQVKVDFGKIDYLFNNASYQGDLKKMMNCLRSSRHGTARQFLQYLNFGRH